MGCNCGKKKRPVARRGFTASAKVEEGGAIARAIRIREAKAKRQQANE